MIAGIDGGGTHTRLELRDDQNRFLCRREFGAFNLNSIGEDRFRALLREVLAACRPLSRLCIGAAGSSNPDMKRILEEELTRSDFAGRWKLCGDQEIALRGAVDGPGIALISGTGSICFGKTADGRTARSGGYGHLIDDGGSGYALGRDALSEAVRACDGRGGDPEICRAVLAYLNAETPADIVRFVYGRDTDKSAIAKVCYVLSDLASAGNPRALAILAAEAAELRSLVAAVCTQLGLTGCPIALFGGMLDTDNPFRRLTAEALAPYGPVITPAHDALWGAAQMAWELPDP